MQEQDKALRDDIRQAWPPGAGSATSSFASAWRAAEKRHVSRRRHYRRFASAAAVVAAVVIALNARSPLQDSYIEVAELLESTYWTAPSDMLLPNRTFDIYQDMPVIFESTDLAEGALL